MLTSIYRAVAIVLLFSLLAVACRSDASVELADTRVPDASDASTTFEADTQETPSEVPAPTTAAAPTPESTPESTPSPVNAEPFTGRPPTASFEAPVSWDDPFFVDGDVVQGVLDNGMSYLIRPNGRPGSQAQLRLVVNAGSLNEEPGTEGVAHFLEHMMFNGTERFPGNEIVQVLEGFGSGFGPDVNAYTSFEETVYELQLPTRSLDTVQLGLDVLFQWATAATLDPVDIVAERGVVREEHRRAVQPLSGRIGEQVREVLFDGTDFLGREPIGSAEVIEAMDEATLRDFYERWYRPELMTIVAVGDFNVAEIERRIVSTFVQPATSPATFRLVPDLGQGTLAEPVFDVITDAEIQRAEVEVLWKLPDGPVQSRYSLRKDVVESIAMSMLNRRLFEAVQGGEAGLLSANAGIGAFTPGAQIASMSAQTDAEMLDDALRALLTEAERARQFGFSVDEFDRSVTSIRASIEQRFAESDTRQDEDLATSLVAQALGREILASAEDQQAIGLEVLDSISVTDAQAFLFDVLAADPYVLVTAPAADEAALASPEQLSQTYYEVVGAVVDQQERAGGDQTELMSRPEPAEIVSRDRIGALDATVVEYANGARLVYKQTQITENVVIMRGSSLGGFFAVEGPEVPLVDASARLVAGSGFESVDIVTLERILAGSIATLRTSIGRSEESVRGDSSTEDIETLLQLVHLQMTEPVITDLQLRQFEEQWRPLATNPSANPAIAGDLELWRLRYGDSPYFRLIPTTEDLDSIDPALLLEAYKERFANAGDFVFAVVGDFDPDELVELGARYLGTLPDAGGRDVPIDRDPGVPEENLVATVRAGIGDQGRVRINWESPYPFTIESAVAAQALDIVVNARLRDLIREELGASYSPSADVTVLSEPKPWVDTIIEVESDPERVEEVSVAIREELERIRNGEFDQQYLSLAIEQLTEDYRFFSNNDWIDLLQFYATYPDRSASEYRDRTNIAQRLTVADIADTARVVFPPTRSVEIWLLPAG